ncbi:MAG: 4-phosphoerythronate dehydrogenase [Rikenellaceae bacterium]
MKFITEVKIIIDSAIPFIEGVFEPFATVVYVAGSKIDREDVRDADALIVRTRTRCDKNLLEGSTIKHIATATIGYDHIDLDYCAKSGIEVTTAAGCNSRGVLQWVGAALSLLSKMEGWQPRQKVLGVIGVGNVGRLIEEYGRAWGFEVICCDPPRGVEGFLELDELLSRADIISLHTPLDSTTRHLINSRNIKLLKPQSTIINSSRGEVVDSRALLENPSYRLLLDVWEGEPNINITLLNRAIVSTPHIAGYSLQGKANGTAIVVNSIAQSLNLPISGWYPDVKRNDGGAITWEEMQRSIGQYFDIERETQQLKGNRDLFEKLRNSYSYRKEYF